MQSSEIPNLRRERNQRYAATETGKEALSRASRNYRPQRNENRRDASLERYLNRPFVAWDGEGVNVDGKHYYVILANSRGGRIVNENGLPTKAIFDLMLASDPTPVHIIFGGGYDINMTLKDLERESLETLYADGRVVWEGYFIEWRPGKSLHIRKRDRKFTLYDVLPFFQCAFVKACDEYLGKNWEGRENIVREKARRGSFTFDEIAGISEYNDAELVALVRLADALKERLYRADIRVRRWDGPGAIATCLYQKYQTKSYMHEVPTRVGIAARIGYAGGRFEIIRKGHSESGAYQYDVRSAYPNAIRNLPCLTCGVWRHVERPTRTVPFGVYRIELTGEYDYVTRPQPLFVRHKDGTVSFPTDAHGWYWTPETDLVLGSERAQVHEGWEYHTQCDCVPFAWVEGLYNKRAALKKAGDGAHVAYKLGLNSLYGKLAQQVGWQEGPPLRIPPFHCLEWAGYITSHCRAKVYRAAMLAPDDIIAFETDAVFSRVPLNVEIGTRLGEWEETKYSSLTYLKSGMYWGTKSDGEHVEKTRGFNKGTMERSAVIHALRNDVRTLRAEQTRFITLGQALHQDFTKWTNWETKPRVFGVPLFGKRMDIYDDTVGKELDDGWTETFPMGSGEMSYEHKVEWITGALTSPDGMTTVDMNRIRNDDLWEVDYE